MSKIELLAPAGDSDSLHAAVENGADAVYLGGRLFNARQSAGNFDIAQLKEDIHYAHVRGVNIYLTMNTLVSDAELGEALHFAKEAAMVGIDSIIVQDLGLAGLLRKALPEMSLHGSTQMTVYDADGAKMLEELGFKRVVLARELPAEEIREIVRSTSLEVEMFVHGALCICYSGQCLMSSIIGGRSGNRGRCAQPCRLPYELLQKSGQSIVKDGSGCDDRNRSRSDYRNNGRGAPQYLLSPKDICLLGSLSEIEDMGVKSLKIEGRMKSPEYVAAVVGTYRKYLDGKFDKVDEQDMHELMQVFNRGGHSEGYFHGKSGRDMMCFEKPKNWGTRLGKVISYNASAETVRIRLEQELAIGDGIEIWNGENESPGTVVSMLRANGGNVSTAAAGSIVEAGYVRGRIDKDYVVYKTSDKRLNAKLNESWKGRFHRRVRLDGRVTVLKEQPVRLEVWDCDGNSAGASGSALPQAAVNKALTKERLEEQLRKTGNTPFELGKLEVELDEGLAIPVSEINEIRRQVLEDIEKTRADKFLAATAGKVSEEAFEKTVQSLNISGREDCISSIDSINSKRSKESESSTDSINGKSSKESESSTDNINSKSSKNSIDSINSKESKSSKNSNGNENIARIAESRKPLITLLFYKWDRSFGYDGLGADRIYLPFASMLDNSGEDVIKACRATGCEVFIQLPSIIRGKGLGLMQKAIDAANSWGADGFLAGNLGTVRLLKDKTDLRLCGDLGLNVFNSNSVMELQKMGLEGVTLSAELTLDQICELELPASLTCEVPIYGRLPVMTSEYCPVGAVCGGHDRKRSCKGSCSKGDYVLRDRKNVEFPVLCDSMNCRTTILNSNVLFVPDTLQRLTKSGVGGLRLYIYDEEPGYVKELAELHRDLLSGTSAASGKHEALISRIRDQGFTKGHYYRGV